jgi:hypothetical protein
MIRKDMELSGRAERLPGSNAREERENSRSESGGLQPFDFDNT